MAGVDTLDRAYINLSGWNGRNADGASLSRSGGAWEAVRIRECQGLLVVIALTDSAWWQVPAGNSAFLAQERAARPTDSVLQPLR